MPEPLHLLLLGLQGLVDQVLRKMNIRCRLTESSDKSKQLHIINIEQEFQGLLILLYQPERRNVMPTKTVSLLEEKGKRHE